MSGIVGAAYAADSQKLTPVQAAQPDSYPIPIALNRGAAGLSRMLLELRTRASMLMIVAHPDDEDGGMLAYETRRIGARTSLLTLNRGEGGQNAMSTDFYDALGLVRTQELMQADRFYGVQQFWGTVIDYGFSKTREEALEQWGYQRVLSDAVRVVRMTRPLIVTSVFVGAPTDGHGNHQVAGQIAQEVFHAAGDPKQFPEQIREGLRPWQPLKVYERVPFFAPTKDNTVYDYATDKYVPYRFYNYASKTWIDHTPTTDVKVPEGATDASAGLTFLQIAREGWGYQRSQNGGGTLPPASLYSAAYHRYASQVPAHGPENSFYDGIDVSLHGIATLSTGGNTKFLTERLAKLSLCVESASAHFRPGSPGAIAGDLAHGLKMTRELIEAVHSSDLAEPGKSNIEFELEQKAKQFETALPLALNLTFQATVAPAKEPSGPFAAFGGQQATFATAIPGQTFHIQTHLIDGGAEKVSVQSILVQASGNKSWSIAAEGAPTTQSALQTNEETGRRFTVKVPDDARFTRAYFGRPSEEQPYYNLTDERFRNLSWAPYPLWASARIAFDGAEWDMRQVVQTNSRLEGIGMVQNPLLIGPAISVSVMPPSGAVPLDTKKFAFTCRLFSNVKGAAKGDLHLQLPEGWKASPDAYPFSFHRDGDTENVSFEITPGTIEQKRYEIRAVADYDGKKYSEGYRMVGYPGVRPYPYYQPAKYEATGVDVKTSPGLRVAYLPGTGDDLPGALADLGIGAVTLSTADLETRDLQSFDAIVLGVRAYSARPELRSAYGKLMQYVKNGGVLIVQYNLQNLDDGNGPYSFSLGSSPAKVVDEKSQVKLLDPSAEILNWPNKITTSDFGGWEEERGHGFMEKWDSHYVPLVEMHDPDQKPQRGGLLVAHYGKGVYIYDALALYRQLPAGVPGAYRLLANLVSAGKSPKQR